MASFTEVADAIDKLNPMALGTREIGNAIGDAITKSNPIKSDVSNLASIGSSLLSVAATLPMFNSNTSVIGIPGNKANLTQFPNISVSVQRYGSKDIPQNTLGRPCYKNVQISTLSGYIKCAGASVDIAGLAGEKEMVNSFLNNGFYYE